MKKQKHEQSSVTFQMPAQGKNTLERLAFRLGLRQLREGEERGNLSAILNLQADYVIENAEQFGEWLKNRVVNAVENKSEKE